MLGAVMLAVAAVGDPCAAERASHGAYDTPTPTEPPLKSGATGPYVQIDGPNAIDGTIVLSDPKCYLSGIGIQWNATSTIGGTEIDFSAIPTQKPLGGPDTALVWIYFPATKTWMNVHTGVRWDDKNGLLSVDGQQVMTGQNGEGGSPTGTLTLSAPLACPKQ